MSSRALALGLILLIFFSKLSFGFLPGVPESFSIFVFQGGLHPYLNVLLNLALGLPLVFRWFSDGKLRSQHKIYYLFCGALALVLSLQTLVQALLVHPGELFFFQFAGLVLALFLVFVFGVVIPTLIPPRQMIDWLWRWSAALVLLSLFLFIVTPDQVFKGGRFTGVFKHIPYMVTVSMVAFVFGLPRLFFHAKKLSFGLFYLLVILSSLYCVLLTGTRSAAAAALLSLFLVILLVPTPTTQLRYLKLSGLALGVSFSLFFGPSLLRLSYEVIRGEQSLMGRAAQDGVATRWEEVERGLAIFERHPFSGLGLMYKFMGSGEAGVNSYNSFKDPHNVFVSAGVIGGWPLLILSGIGMFLLAGALILKLFDTNLALRWIAVYMLSHLPILLIYHVHLSLGGMADRIYWLGIGYMALISTKNPEKIPD